VEVSATSKYIRISPRKVRLVIDLIRGKPVQEAMALLTFVPKEAAREVAKTLKSAVANAEQNNHLSAEDLIVSRAWVGPGPTIKRYRAAARGRAAPILKRSSHITVVVAEKEG
jgi:large subunit ribosomal protein L22